MSKTIVKPVSTKPTLLDEINEVTSKTYNVKEEITKLIEPKVNSLDELAENALKSIFGFEKYKGNNPIAECFHELTLDFKDACDLYKAGYQECATTMYSEEQLQSEICKHNAQTIENCMKTMYSEDEVKLLCFEWYLKLNPQNIRVGQSKDFDEWWFNNKKKK